jgi:D-alanine-D-alanine ligase
LKASGIPTAKSCALDKGDAIDANAIVETVGLPCFVKANRAGSSFGVFKVYREDDLLESIQKAFEEDTQLIIESFLDGREVSVGVATLENIVHVLPITEIISENDFFDYGAKYLGESQEITPANIPENWEKQVQKLSKKIYFKLGLKGIVRSEFIFVKNVAHLLEINSVPGMTANSIVPQQVNADGMELSDFFTKILKQIEAR